MYVFCMWKIVYIGFGLNRHVIITSWLYVRQNTGKCILSLADYSLINSFLIRTYIIFTLKLFRRAY